MEIVVAFLAGICPDWWPFPRWWRKKWWWPWPPPPPPRPDERSLPELGGRPEPWDFLGGLIAGAGGAIAWVVIGPDFGGEDSLLEPVVIGVLGGVAASFLVDAAGSLGRQRR